MNDNSIFSRRSEIGATIKKERERKGLTINGLADEICKILGTRPAQSTITMWELGQSFPKNIEMIFALARIFECDCGYLLGDYEERTHDTMGICKATGLSEESVNTLCSLKTWGADRELASVIDALVFDYRYATKGEGIAPLAYLISFFLKFNGSGKTEKMVHVSGEVVDCNDENGYLASTLKLDDRAIENAALIEIQQGLTSLKKRLSRKERGKHGKH